MPAYIPDGSIPEDYRSSLNIIMEAMPEHFSGRGAKTLSFRKCAPDALTVSLSDTGALISAGTRNAFLRGVACALAGREVAETMPFTTFGVMLDCSRNRVYTVDFIRDFLRKIALAGYNLLMLYTEDVYELPGEPAFGYMRGRYTKEEIRAVSDYADQLGIELTACIQTLGHLEHLFTHYQYSNLQDTPDILLADVPETYALIEKMIRFQAENLKSRQIHIGMDEAHNLGRGKHLDRHGWEAPETIFLRHLSNVCGICEKYGMKPIIWSDMLFHFPNPESLRSALPENLKLCHWNYSARESAVYAEQLERHRALGRETMMASTVHTYNMFCWFAEKSESVIPACVKACNDTSAQELLITVWGDAGAFCNTASALAGLVYTASIAFGEPDNDTELTAALFKILCGEDYVLFREAAKLHRIIDGNVIPVPGLLWQDPLQGGIYSYCFSKYPASMQVYLRDLKELHRHLSLRELSPSLCEIHSVIGLLLCGIAFREKLLSAYADRNRELLREIIECSVPAYLERVEAFDACFREEWMRSAKPFGLEIIQRRNAGLAARVKETALRIRELLNGTRERIEELDEALRVASSAGFSPAPPVFSSCLEKY